MNIHIPHFRFLVIEGNIGAGKTSLATRISNYNKAGLILEQFAENPFLERFYQNPQAYSLQVELFFLMQRHKQLLKELQPAAETQGVVSDYYFVKSLLFAQTTLPADEFNLYKQIFDSLYIQFPKPELFIYLHQNVPSLLKNIKKRGRPYEQKIPASYLEKIEKSYFSFFETNPEFPIVVADVSKIDFVEIENDYTELISTVFGRTYGKGLTFLQI